MESNKFYWMNFFIPSTGARQTRWKSAVSIYVEDYL